VKLEFQAGHGAREARAAVESRSLRRPFEPAGRPVFDHLAGAVVEACAGLRRADPLLPDAEVTPMVPAYGTYDMASSVRACWTIAGRPARVPRAAWPAGRSAAPC